MKNSRDQYLQWVAVTPTPYNQFFFEQLQESLGERFVVHYQRDNSGYVNWRELNLDNEWIRFYHTSLGVDWGLCWRVLRKSNTLVALSGWNDPTKRLLLVLLWLLRRPYVVWTDTPRIGGLKRRIRDLILRPFLRRARGVLGTGVMAVDRLQSMGVPPQKAVNFPYWVPLPAVWQRNASAESPTSFLCIGRMVQYKGFHLVIRAMAALKDLEVELVLVGDGPDRENLETLTEDLSLKDRVHFLGWMESRDIYRCMRERSHCLVHPPIDLEPYGVVVIEALAHGLPVIGTDVCGAIVDRVVEGENGFILPAPATGETLATFMRMLAEDPIRRQSMGAAARVSAEAWQVDRGVAMIKALMAKS